MASLLNVASQLKTCILSPRNTFTPRDGNSLATVITFGCRMGGRGGRDSSSHASCVTERPKITAQRHAVQTQTTPVTRVLILPL